MKVYVLDTRLHNVISSKVLAAVQKMKIDNVYFSEFSFCPYLYAYKDEKEVINLGNLNDGAIDHKRMDVNFAIIDCESLENFIREVFTLKFGKQEEAQTNALF